MWSGAPETYTRGCKYRGREVRTMEGIMEPKDPTTMTEDERNAWRQLAADRYAAPSDDDIEINDDATLVQSEGGMWVAAWVYVRTPGVDA